MYINYLSDTKHDGITQNNAENKHERHLTLYISFSWLETQSATQGGLVVAISMTQHPTLHTSQERP